MEKAIMKLSDLIKTNEFNVKEGESLIISDPCYDFEQDSLRNPLPICRR